ncbi:MAG: chorismate mutase [Candidatus Nitrosocosmicus sp.]
MDMNEFDSNFSSLDEIRADIDKLDKEIVGLLCKRGEYVKQAARFKTTASNIKDSKRLEQIVEKVTSYAKDHRFDPFIIETIYRNMIDIFIQLETKAYENLKESDLK